MLLKTVRFTRTDEASDPLTKAALQATQTASSSSCCGFGNTWRFPSIQYGLHVILPWSVAVWTVCVGCVGKFYSRKLRGRLLQYCDCAVLPCQKRRSLSMLEIGGERGLQQLKWTIMHRCEAGLQPPACHWLPCSTALDKLPLSPVINDSKASSNFSQLDLRCCYLHRADLSTSKSTTGQLPGPHVSGRVTAPQQSVADLFCPADNNKLDALLNIYRAPTAHYQPPGSHDPRCVPQGMYPWETLV